MSDMKKLLEAMTFAGEPKQKPGDYSRGEGNVKPPKKFVGKVHRQQPDQNKLVGGESVEVNPEGPSKNPFAVVRWPIRGATMVKVVPAGPGQVRLFTQNGESKVMSLAQYKDMAIDLAPKTEEILQDGKWDNEFDDDDDGFGATAGFNDGDQVKLRPEYADDPNEIFTVSQCDPERNRCWIGDEEGRGWFASFGQLISADETEIHESLVAAYEDYVKNKSVPDAKKEFTLNRMKGVPGAKCYTVRNEKGEDVMRGNATDCQAYIDKKNKSLDDARLEESGALAKIAKNIKRGIAGWGSDSDSPKDVVARNKAYDPETQERLHSPDGKPGKHSPQALQQKVLGREIAKRQSAKDKAVQWNPPVEESSNPTVDSLVQKLMHIDKRIKAMPASAVQYRLIEAHQALLAKLSEIPEGKFALAKLGQTNESRGHKVVAAKLKDIEARKARDKANEPAKKEPSKFNQATRDFNASKPKGLAEIKADPLGAWIAHKDGKQPKKFKTREGAKKYVASHEGFTINSSEGFHNNYSKKKEVEETVGAKMRKVIPGLGKATAWNRSNTKRHDASMLAANPDEPGTEADIAKKAAKGYKQAKRYDRIASGEKLFKKTDESIGKSENRELWDRIKSRGTTANIDREKYTERPGLEGPFKMKNGKVVYYDPKEGAYWDPETDIYLDKTEQFEDADQDAVKTAKVMNKKYPQPMKQRPGGKPEKAGGRITVTPGVPLSKAYKDNFDGKVPQAKLTKPVALTKAYSKTGKAGGELKEATPRKKPSPEQIRKLSAKLDEVKGILAKVKAKANIEEVDEAFPNDLAPAAVAQRQVPTAAGSQLAGGNVPGQPQVTAQQAPAPMGLPTAKPAAGQQVPPAAGQAGGAPIKPSTGTVTAPATGNNNASTTPGEQVKGLVQTLASNPGAAKQLATKMNSFR